MQESYLRKTLSYWFTFCSFTLNTLKASFDQINQWGFVIHRKVINWCWITIDHFPAYSALYLHTDTAQFYRSSTWLQMCHIYWKTNYHLSGMCKIILHYAGLKAQQKAEDWVTQELNSESRAVVKMVYEGENLCWQQVVGAATELLGRKNWYF